MPYVVKCEDPSHSQAQYLILGPHVISIKNTDELQQVLDDDSGSHDKVETYAFPSGVFDDIQAHLGQ